MSAGRSRLVFAAGAIAVLGAAGAVAVVSGSGSSELGAEASECIATWNEDPIARSDGAHAYADHSYRATLVTEDKGRCLVVFATDRVDFEPGFGVRVQDAGRWLGLAEADGVPLERIAELQRDATESANVMLLPDGRLAD